MRLSARNQIPARVTGITAGEAIANVELDANGVRLVASITVEAVRDLGLAEGSEVNRSDQGVRSDPRHRRLRPAASLRPPGWPEKLTWVQTGPAGIMTLWNIWAPPQDILTPLRWRQASATSGFRHRTAARSS